MSLRSALVSQFARPTGALGHLAGMIMARRPSNVERNLRTVALLDIGPEDVVLELGFGPGVGLAAALARASRGKVVGVDHSPVMLKMASARCRSALEEGRLELRLGSIEALEDAPRFDRIFAVNVSMFLSDREGVLRRLHERLQPGGLIALTHQPRKPGATSEDATAAGVDLAQALLQAGFTAPRIERLSMQPVDAVCVLASR